MSRPLSFMPLRAFALAASLALTSGAVAVAQTARTVAVPANSVRLQPLTGDYVTVGRTNLRQQPSQQGTRIGQFEAGVTVKVTGKVADAPWYAVTREDGRTGYVFADLLRPVVEPAAAPTVSAPASAPAAPPADPVGTALADRLDKMESTLSDIRQRIAEGQVVQGVAERQQALESAIAALRNDVAGLRGAAVEGDKPGGFMDRLIGLQEQISAQIAEQRAELEKLTKRLDSAEEWLKPMKDWSQQTLNGIGPSQGWMDWLWSGYAATRSWMTEGWWWQAPAAPDASPIPAAPAAQPTPPGERQTIMG